MSRRELISIEGLRIDGRRPTELRKLVSRVGVLADADGSSYIELGNTKILAAVYGPREHQRKTETNQDGQVDCCCFMNSNLDRRLLELAQSVKQTFEPIVLTQLSSRSQIDIYLQVLQNDGGVLQACINASTLALIHAGVPMSDYVCATSAGFFENTAVLDINQIEESSSQSPEVTVAISPLNGKVILLQIESKLHIEQFKGVVELAIQGCHQVKDLLDKTIRLNTLKLSEQRNSHN